VRVFDRDRKGAFFVDRELVLDRAGLLGLSENVAKMTALKGISASCNREFDNARRPL
jgi:hypothetical protein